MIEFTVCNAAGFVTGRGTAPEEVVEHQADPGGFVVRGRVPDGHWVRRAADGTVSFEPLPANEVGPGAELDPATLTWRRTPYRLAQLAQEAKALRDARLARSDWVVTRALESGEPVPPAWIAYRQALRDVTAQAGFPLELVWPLPPDASSPSRLPAEPGGR